ncbi:helix-turn-helix domain-containing protein [Clostridium paraputrificum]|jgi:transcriptional regulator with XRE-family HTH domain|uniref:helix-turn-helix domain-containing protein n=1 Tax=Clostridium paraputrificum TaxID=29363 RepID=UPI00374FBC6E
MAIGKAILLIAKEKNITKYRISKLSGVTQTTLGEITNGKNKNPTVETLEKIANGIGIPLSELLRRAEKISKEETKNE